MEITEYFSLIQQEVEKAYDIAERARKKHLDPKPYVEIAKAYDVATRVEGLLKVKGISDYIRKKEKEGKSRVDIAFSIVKDVCNGNLIEEKNREKLAEIAIRIGTAILTEGILVAPTEGIEKVKIEKYKGNEYLAVYYSGPIRSAGGTVAGLTVLLADTARICLNIPAFKPDEKEINRVIEEINIYDIAKARLQYMPKEEDIRTLLENCPIAIDGEGSEDIEVSVNRDHERIKTNRIRGGVPLVICEGLLQKAAKIYKYAMEQKLDHWSFIKALSPVKEEEKSEVYLDGLVIGRPIFSYPNAVGGFRLRYGKTFTNGIMAKAVHPATMAILDDFLAYGSQIKIEKPGKSAVIVACESIEGPVVKLKDGSVKKVRSYEEAKAISNDVAEIIYLGDILISVGDFVKSGIKLLKPGYVEEIWRAEIKNMKKELEEPKNVYDAFSLSENYKVPLHPIALLYWDAISKDDLLALYRELKENIDKDFIEVSQKVKRALELLAVEHIVKNGRIIVLEEYKIILKKTLFAHSENDLIKALEKNKKITEALSELLGFPVYDKQGTFIGARLGRPEKAAQRIMEGKPNVLFPTGKVRRSLTALYSSLKADHKNEETFVVKAFLCEKCNKKVPYKKCPFCDELTKETMEKECRIDFIELLDKTIEKIGYKVSLNGVQGLMNKEKIAERLEKGILRAFYGLYVFRDGTIRFDGTNVPLTCFYAKDANVSLEKLKSLGYEKDIYGNELVDHNQILELKPQDMIINESVAKKLVDVAKFIDDELTKLYGEKPYYNVENVNDIIGKLVITISPHTSCGHIARIIGFTKAKVFYCHPYLISARRRNADGDEDSIMLLLDGLLNFSQAYLSNNIWATMDSPLILNVIVNPKEVDDEVHAMETCSEYSYEFYKKALNEESINMDEYESVFLRLGTKNQYEGIFFTHDKAYLSKGVLTSKYVQLQTIQEKAEKEIELMKKIRAVKFKDALERVITSHFIPDIYGNLRKFSKQSYRCSSCNKKYRRVPLKGKCLDCSGNIVLTIHRGTIEKYLDYSLELVEKYSLSNYMKQRLMLIKEEVKSLFEDEKLKQKDMSQFFT